MYCEVCCGKVNNKVSFQNIFSKEKHQICSRCFTKYPVILEYEVIPLEKFVIMNYTLCKKTYLEVAPIIYQSFLKPLYLKFLRDHKNSIILYFDYLTNDLIELLDMNLGDIFLISIYKI